MKKIEQSLEQLINSNLTKIKSVDTLTEEMEKELVSILKLVFGSTRNEIIFKTKSKLEAGPNYMIMPIDYNYTVSYDDDDDMGSYMESLKFFPEYGTIHIKTDEQNSVYMPLNSFRFSIYKMKDFSDFLISCITKQAKLSKETLYDNKKSDIKKLEKDLYNSYIDFISNYIVDNAINNTIHLTSYPAGMSKDSYTLVELDMVLPCGDNIYTFFYNIEDKILMFDKCNKSDNNVSDYHPVDESLTEYLRVLVDKLK